MAKVYVVGDKQEGVVLIMLDPLRAAIIPRAAIEAYATSSGSTFDETFGKVAAAVQEVVTRGGNSDVPAADQAVFDAVGALAARGTVVSDAAFVHIADIDAASFDSIRHRDILAAAVNVLAGDTGGTAKVVGLTNP